MINIINVFLGLLNGSVEKNTTSLLLDINDLITIKVMIIIVIIITIKVMITIVIIIVVIILPLIEMFSKKESRYTHSN